MITNTNHEITQKIQLFKEVLNQKKPETSTLTNINDTVREYFNDQSSNINKSLIFKNKIFITENYSHLFFSQAIIGKGSYGCVFEVLAANLNKEFQQLKRYALKKAISTKHVEKLKNEYIITNILNPKGKQIEGIQSRLKEFTVVTHRKSDKSQAFCYTKIMSGDLLNLCLIDKFNGKFEKLKTLEKLNLCGQILSGVDHIHSEGYLHGDLKPANCLFQFNEKGEPETFVITDFGGATKIGVKSKAFTVNYRPTDTSRDDPLYDVFAASLTLIEILTGKKLRQIIEKKSEPRNPKNLREKYAEKIYTLLNEKKIPRSVIEVLIRGISPKNIRPTAKQLKRCYDQAASFSFGDLYDNGNFLPNFQKFDFVKRLKLCENLLNDVVKIHQLGYLHGNIKPENCLIKLDNKGEQKKFHINTFNGLTKIDQIPEYSTATYLPEDTHPKSPFCDVFAISLSLIEILAATSIEEITSTYIGRSTPAILIKKHSAKICNFLKKCQIPKSIRDVLLKGIGPLKNRPTAAELKQAYTKALSEL